MRREKIETAIIGGGQAGLAMSYHLRRRNREHLVLERARIAERWRSERWDSLTFQFPNWAMELPGSPYQSEDPEGFAPRDEVVKFIEDFATKNNTPIRCGASVTLLRQKPGSARFEIEIGENLIEAANVIIATGPYQRPAIPPELERSLSSFVQVHSSGYRNPSQLPGGAVLVVGSGNSGCQIVEDLLRNGRRAFLAVGSHRRAPRRYRGRDCTWWQFAFGEYDQTRRPDQKVARLLTGVDGGHDMDLRQLAADGATLLGHMLSAQDGKVLLASDLAASLAQGDAGYDAFFSAADDYARRNGLHLSDEPLQRERAPIQEEVAEPILELDLKAAEVSSIIWANGYHYDFAWVQLPIFSNAGASGRLEPIHRRGVANVPGVYFLGLPWLSKHKSSLMMGVGEDAAFIADNLVMRSYLGQADPEISRRVPHE